MGGEDLLAASPLQMEDGWRSFLAAPTTVRLEAVAGTAGLAEEGGRGKGWDEKREAG